MKPPTSKAVERALVILIQSINEENGTLFAVQKSDQTLGHTGDELEQNALAIRMAHESVEYACKTWTANLMKSRNSHTPIGSLPVELTAEILLGSLRVKDRSNMKHLQGLSMVCTRWWDIILSFPRFWTTISSHQNVESKLQRSGNMPLVIALHGGSAFTFNTLDIAAIRKNYKRCKILQLSDDALEDFPWQLGTTEMPLLEKVDIGSSQGDTYLDLPAINSVHSVRLRSVATDWGRLTGLKNLHISNLDDVPSAVELTDILRSCSLLETLELENLEVGSDYHKDIFFDDELPAEERRAKPIELPELRRLVLRCITPWGSELVVGSIEVKSLLDFQLVENNTSRGGVCTRQCRFLVQSVLKNAPIDRIVLSIAPTGVEMKAAGPTSGDGKLLFLHPTLRLVIIRGLTSLVPKTAAVDLHLTIPMSHPTFSDAGIIDTMLDRLEQIESLNLTMNPTMVIQIANKLSKPYPSEGKASEGVQWPAHRLCKIRVNTAPTGFDFTVVKPSLAALLDARSQATGIALPTLEVTNEDGFIFSMLKEGVREWTRP